MSDSAGMNDHHDLFEGGESNKSSSSQESGLCSTMLAVDESMGSLEELSENLHQHLDTHIDHTSLLHYELDMLRSQLNEKNRLISTQQITIKQLQDTLNETQKDLAEVRKVADMEINCKNETIDILQSDLIDSQQQHANCLQQVMNQNRVLSGIREDDAVLIEKMAQLEKRLRKTTVRTVAIQTDVHSRNCENINIRQTNSSFKHPSPSFSPPSSYRRRNRVTNLQPSFRFLCDDMIEDRDGTDSPQSSHHFANHLTSTPQQQRNFSESGCEANPSWAHQFQDLLTEIRQIQNILKSTKEQSGPEDPVVHTSRNKNPTVRSDELSEFWNTITEERQHRIQLDHLIRQIELDILDVRSQIQSCKARLQVEQPSSSSHWSYCPSKCCCSAAHQDIAKSLYRCTDTEEVPLPNLYPKPRPTTSLFTLV